MATIAEIRALGDTATVISSPLAEPLNAPMRFEERLHRFGEHYNTNQDSHLFKFLVSLCGDAGAGILKREKLYPRLQQILASTYFTDIDKLYGNPIGISRLPKELYIYDPHNEALTQEQWIEVFSKDASYRERCLTWMRAIIEGPTPRGIALAAEAACGFECDVYENYNYIDHRLLGRTGTMITLGGYGKAAGRWAGRLINDSHRLDSTEGDGAVASSSYGVWSANTNLITNGSFKDATNWLTSAVGTHTVSGASLTISNTEYKFAGTARYSSIIPEGAFEFYQGTSAHLVTSGVDQGMHQLVSTSSQVPLTIYTASFWIKRVAGSGQITAQLGPTSVGGTALTVTPTTTWTRYTLSWTATTASACLLFKQFDASATDVYIDGVQVEEKPIATPFSLTTRTTSDLQLSNPNVHLSHEIGWVAIKFKPSWAATVDNFNVNADQPTVWSWLGATNTGSIRLFFDPTTNQFTLERTNYINPSAKTVSVSTAHAAEASILLVASWSGSNIALSINAGAYTSNSTATGLTPIHTGNFYLGSKGLTEFLEGNIESFATGKTYQPSVSTINTQLGSDTPDPNLFPAQTTSFWNAKTSSYSFTGSDNIIAFPQIFSKTNSRNEFVIIPQVTDLEQKERRAIIRLVDKLRPVNTIATIDPGSILRNELPILDVAASSTRYNVLRNVTGNTNIDWPDLDPEAGYWIDENTREAPTFAFLDRQEAATYLSVKDVTASTEHTGQFNEFQRSLFAHLSNQNDLTIFTASKSYAKAVAPLNITTPWIMRGDKEKLLVNNHYPLGYFTQENIDISVAENNFDFWASTEKYAPASDELIIDLDVNRPFNFIDFNISQKPINITIEYNNNGIWVPIKIKEGYEADYSVSYLPSVDNPWAYHEYNFDLIQSDKIRITMTRREDVFPDGNPTAYPWSIELQNLRIIHLISTIEDFVIDSGTDILGNMFETDIFEYDVANVIDPDDPELYSYWQSQPNPTRHAVEALYFDLRDNITTFTMATLNGKQMNVLDTYDMMELTTHYTASVLVDEVFIDPITNGCDMHFYYSTDDSPNWDDKLWIPVPGNYILRRGYHALPSPTAVKYFKIEFSNLTPVPYQFIEYPKNITIRFRRYPTWVQNYFHELYPTEPYEEAIEVVDIIKIDPLKYGYQQYQDALSTGYTDLRAKLFRDTTEDVKDFIEDVVQGGQQQRFDQFEIERRITFYNPLMWQSNLFAALDPTRALTRKVQKLINPLINEIEWMAELSPPTSVPPIQKSVPSLADSADEKRQPILWFSRAARHGYQIIEGRFNNRVAYHVAISNVKFCRRDMSIRHDDEIYFETLEDEAHLTSNNLVQLDTYRWGVS